MNDIKNSTLGERILLGIIAGLFGLVGFYIGYEHLSNGVNPILIGAITAIIVMLGCMAAAFILEELIRKIPAAKNNGYEKIRKEPLFGNKKKPSVKTETKDVPSSQDEAKAEEPKQAETIPEQKPAFAKRMTLLSTADAVKLSNSKTNPEKVEPKVADVVKKEEPKVEEVPVASSEWDEEEIIVKPKPVAPVRPVAPKAPVKDKEETPVKESSPAKETSTDALSLREFIKAHPEFSARKMVKEYRLAGGTESTDDILNLMN